jgi:hypothetical protein
MRTLTDSAALSRTVLASKFMLVMRIENNGLHMPKDTDIHRPYLLCLEGV